MKKIILSIAIIVTLCSCFNDEKKQSLDTENPFPKTIFRDANMGETIQVNDSILLVYRRTGISTSEVEVVNIKRR